MENTNQSPNCTIQGKINQTRDNDLTVEEIKACDIFSHFNDKEAKEVIRTMKKLSEIIYLEYLQQEESLDQDLIKIRQPSGL